MEVARTVIGCRFSVLKFAFMKPESTKQHTEKHGHPWDTIFHTPEPETDFGETEKELSLRVWARRVAEEEPYSNVGLFRKTVVIRLRTLRYRPPDSKTEAETFERILRTASVLKKILNPAVLENIRKWVMLSRTFKKERESRDYRKLTVGFPLQFHKSFMTELQRHSDQIEEIARKFDSEKGIERHRSAIFREIVQQFRALFSANNPQTLRSALGEAGINYPDNNEEVIFKGELYLCYEARNTERAHQAVRYF